MSIEEYGRRLTHMLEQWRDGECLALLDRARDEALELLHNAHRRARRQLHQAVEEERGRARTRLRAAQAELETQRRAHRQRLGFAVLEEARQRLPLRLRARWSDPDGRRAWIHGAVARGLARLPEGRWTVRHPDDFGVTDFTALLQALQVRPGGEPALVTDPVLEAGLVIECGGVRLDASATGLLADHAAVDARLLALMELENESGGQP